MPRRIRADGVDTSLTSPEKPKGMMTPGRLRIEEHFRNSQCILCRSFSDEGEQPSHGLFYMRNIYISGLCERCCATPAETISELLSQVQIAENRIQTAHSVCTMCTRSEPLEPVRCVSLDCPWLFQRKKVEQQAEDIELLQELILALQLGDNTRLESQDSDEEPREDDGEEIKTGIVRPWDDISED
jgi:DNA polymerase zeta